jgi:hypothetical protein
LRQYRSHRSMQGPSANHPMLNTGHRLDARSAFTLA